MKTIKIYLFVCATLAILTSCGGSGTKEPADPAHATSCALVAGEWHLTDGAGNATTGYDIYLRLTADGKFEMYQQLQATRYTEYKGTFAFAGKVMSGKYDDGISWHSSYTAVLNASRSTLTLTSTTEPDNVSVFTRTTIPTEVFDHIADDTSRAAIGEIARFF